MTAEVIPRYFSFMGLHSPGCPSASVLVERFGGLLVVPFLKRSSKSRTNRRDFSALIGAVRSPDGRFPEEFLHSAPNSRCVRRIRLFQTRASRSNEFHFSQSRTIRDRRSVAPHAT